MKQVTLILICILAIQGLGIAQDSGVNPNNNSLGALASYGPDGANIGASSLVVNPPRKIEGTVYVFDQWNNRAIIEAGGKKYSLRGINFNAKDNVFQSKIANTDSIFTFDFTNIEKINVNNKSFKNVYSPIAGGYRVMEVMAEAGDIAIYKDYSIDIKEGNPNPMLAQSNDKYILRDSYYVKKGKSFKRFKMKKSNFLKLMGRKSKEVDLYADEKDLSYKNGMDLQKMLDYYNTL